MESVLTLHFHSRWSLIQLAGLCGVPLDREMFARFPLSVISRNFSDSMLSVHLLAAAARAGRVDILKLMHTRSVIKPHWLTKKLFLEAGKLTHMNVKIRHSHTHILMSNKLASTFSCQINSPTLIKCGEPMQHTCEFKRTHCTTKNAHITVTRVHVSGTRINACAYMLTGYVTFQLCALTSVCVNARTSVCNHQRVFSLLTLAPFFYSHIQNLHKLHRSAGVAACARVPAQSCVLINAQHNTQCSFFCLCS